MNVKKMCLFLVLTFILPIAAVFAQNYVVQGVDWNNANARVSTHFTVGEVFTTGSSVDWNRRNALFALPTSERDRIISNILRMARELDGVRQRYGRLKVLSWYRDAATNSNIRGAAENSAHIQGHGVDIQPLDFNGATMERELEASWHGGLGRGQARNRGFTHLDLGGNRRWNY
jgi:putative chitinase